MADNVVQANPRVKLPISLLGLTRDDYIDRVVGNDTAGMVDPLNQQIPSMAVDRQPPTKKPNVSNIRDLPSKSSISPAMNPITNRPDLQGQEAKPVSLLDPRQEAVMDAVTNTQPAASPYTKVADLRPSKPMIFDHQTTDTIKPIMQGPLSRAAEFVGEQAKIAGRQAAFNLGVRPSSAPAPEQTAPPPLVKPPNVQNTDQPVPTTVQPPQIAPPPIQQAAKPVASPAAAAPVAQPIATAPAAQPTSAATVAQQKPMAPVSRPSSPVAPPLVARPAAPVQPQPGSIDNLDRVAAASPLIRGMTNSGVLRASSSEVDLLNRMRREGAQGSRSTHDLAAQAAGVTGTGVKAQQYDMFGKRLAADQVANQQSLIQSQGQAAAMPAEAQARGNVAMQQEKTKEGLGVADITGKAHVAGMVGSAEQQAKAAQAGLQAQRETIAAEKQTGREFTAEQKRLDREHASKLHADRISSATERQNTEDLSRELRDTAKSIAGGDTTALVSLVNMYKSIGQDPNPAVAKVWHAEVQRALLPKVYELAKPGASNADKTAIYQAILKANGDLTAIYSDPAIAKLIVSANK